MRSEYAYVNVFKALHRRVNNLKLSSAVYRFSMEYLLLCVSWLRHYVIPVVVISVAEKLGFILRS